MVAVAADPSRWRAEWKWDGIRVQLCAAPGGTRMWSRTGEDVSAVFPEVVEAMAGWRGVLDGELLVVRDGVVAPFADLQQRLNRKAVTPKMQRDYPVGVRLYDLLLDGEQVQKIAERTPLKRVGRIEEMADVIRFLMTPAAGFITGQTLVVDGGLSC